LYAERFGSDKRQSNKEGWHSDITFEPVPSDYAILRLTELPKTGGDTLWASGYEVYDRLSTAYQKFLEGLTATYAQPIFNESAEKNNFQLYSAERGAPENVGTDLKVVHPVIRTNPVTGWKSVYAVGHHAKHINEVTKAESDHLLNWFTQLIVENHDLQVRNRWANPNDLAIWDNRSVYHTATYDYDGPRTGQRAVSLGERPYLDPQSVSRRHALAQQTSASS
jgi:alpha-ketoglutarate-dependent taurine dioxygenase